MKVAIVIGHRKGSPGARNIKHDIAEYGFNEALAMFIEKACGEHEVVVVRRDSYQGLPGKVNELQPDFIISLHCNAYEEKENEKEATGTETLYYHKSMEGLRLAGMLQRHMVRALGLPDRKVRKRRVEDRGGYFLKYTNAPAVIIEPFFIDNDTDLEVVNARLNQLAHAIIAAINEFANTVKKGG